MTTKIQIVDYDPGSKTYRVEDTTDGERFDIPRFMFDLVLGGSMSDELAYPGEQYEWPMGTMKPEPKQATEFTIKTANIVGAVEEQGPRRRRKAQDLDVPTDRPMTASGDAW